MFYICITKLCHHWCRWWLVSCSGPSHYIWTHAGLTKKQKKQKTCWLNTLRPRQNGRHFPDDIFKWIFLNENVWISISIPLKFVPRGPINNIPTLVQVIAWRRPGDKPLSEPMMVRLPTHICVTRPQWVNCYLDTLRYKFPGNLNKNTTIFPQQNWFENVICETVSILSQPQCVKTIILCKLFPIYDIKSSNWRTSGTVLFCLPE